MIQVGYLKSFHTDEGEKITYFKTIKGFAYGSLKECFSKVEKDLDKFLKKEDQKNLFYTVAHHLEGERKFTSWQAQEIIPFDLDGIDLDRIDEYAPILAKTLEIDIDKCAIVYSGNGCHILVQVKLWGDKEFIKQARLGYRQLLDRLVEAFKEAGLPLDKDTTAWDYARILRLPFTKNIKIKEVDGKEVEVIKNATLVSNGLEEQELVVPILEKVRDGLSLDKGSWPEPDIKEITTKCDFFKWLRVCPDEVHEPHAYAMLSITGHFNDDNKTSAEYWHKFNSPSINSKNLGELTEQAITTSNPRTCAGINQVYGNCDKCEHYNKITSPIMLKDKNFIGTESMGFTLTGTKGGKIRQYEDLVKYLEREKKYKHVTATGQVFIYKDGYYSEAKDGYIKNFALSHFTGPTKATERVEFLNYVKDYRDDGVDFLNGEINDGLINFRNGVLDIQTKTLLPHDSKYGFFYILPYDYDRNATSPIWDNFLKEITLDRQELGNILEEYLGYAIRGGSYKYHKALILSGDGKNGKSTFNDVLKALIGADNYSSTALTKMATSTFSLSDLQGKLVNISEEEPPHCFKDTGIFKNITGNNTVTAEKKFKDSFQMVNKAKIVITYNEMPFISDSSTGMRRRLMIIPFDLDLEHGEHKENNKIGEQLLSEISGIANRAIEGFERLEEQGGFTKSKLIEAEVKEIFEDSNPFYAWYNEAIELIEYGTTFVKSKDIYNDYAQYMESNSMGRSILGNRKVSKILKQKGIKHGQKKVGGVNFKGFFGLALRNNTAGSNMAVKF